MKNNKWTYDECQIIANSCISQDTFMKQYPIVFNISQMNNWLLSFTYTKQPIMWTYDMCYKLASECTSRHEYNKKYNKAYQAATHYKWIDSYNQFLSLDRSIKWTYDKCLDAAKQCISRTEFSKKYRGAYYQARKNKWIDNYTWFASTKKLKQNKVKGRPWKWTYDICKQESLKYTTYAEFNKNSHNTYRAARKLGYLSSFTWLKRSIDHYNNDYVYAYIFEYYHTIYIGRTIKPNMRHAHHLNDVKSAVYKFAYNNSINIPNMTIL